MVVMGICNVTTVMRKTTKRYASNKSGMLHLLSFISPHIVPREAIEAEQLESNDAIDEFEFRIFLGAQYFRMDFRIQGTISFRSLFKIYWILLLL